MKAPFASTQVQVRLVPYFSASARRLLPFDAETQPRDQVLERPRGGSMLKSCARWLLRQKSPTE
jgi:hypothetical protein